MVLLFIYKENSFQRPCVMLKWYCYIFVMTLSVCAHAQIRSGTFVVEAGQTFDLKNSDIIVADTFIMMDASRLKLNKAKRENYLRVKVAIFGKNVVIDGRGVAGIQGKKGTAGTTMLGPCREGTSAKAGARGTDGGQGVNLFLYVDKIIVNGNLVIDLSGGNGGDGGDGGEGGGGSPGTRHCYGGNGGTGGDGGPGGDGGKGGVLTFGGADVDVVKVLVGSQIILNTFGGNFGYGGLAGSGGSPGLGPSKHNGTVGRSGKDGTKGRPGINGGIQFEQQ
jgi:hypothetical protein